MRSERTLLPAKQYQVNRAIWLAIGVIMTVDLAVCQYVGMSIHVRIHRFDDVSIIGTCALIALIYGHLFRDGNIFLLGNVLGQGIGIAFAACIAQHLGHRLNLPLIDGALITADRMMGFNWQHYVAWMDTKPLLEDIFRFSYLSSVPLVLIVVFALFARRQSDYAQRYIIAYFFTLAVTIALGVIFPAIGPYKYYNIDFQHFKYLHPVVGHYPEIAILSLRDHTMTSIVFPGQGLIYFPSFHAVMAILLIYASLPLRYMRLIIIPLNIFILFSAPADGGHYLTDVVAGVILAGLGIYIAERILPRKLPV